MLRFYKITAAVAFAALIAVACGADDDSPGAASDTTTSAAPTTRAPETTGPATTSAVPATEAPTTEVPTTEAPATSAEVTTVPAPTTTEAPATTSTTAVTDTTPGADDDSTGDDGQFVANFDFIVGQCLDQVADGWDVLACEVPHDFQVYALFDVEGGDAYPGAEAVELQAEPGCISSFETFIGRSFATSIFSITLLEPTPASWLLGDREIVCLAVAPDGAQLDRDLEGVNE